MLERSGVVIILCAVTAACNGVGAASGVLVEDVTSFAVPT